MENSSLWIRSVKSSCHGEKVKIKKWEIELEIVVEDQINSYEMNI